MNAELLSDPRFREDYLMVTNAPCARAEVKLLALKTLSVRPAASELVRNDEARGQSSVIARLTYARFKRTRG